MKGFGDEAEGIFCIEKFHVHSIIVIARNVVTKQSSPVAIVRTSGLDCRVGLRPPRNDDLAVTFYWSKTLS